MTVHHRLLHRMQRTAGGLEAFHGEYRLAVERGQQADAGVDRRQLHTVATGSVLRQLADHDGACTAIALGAALFGASAVHVLAQPVEQRAMRVDTGQLNQ